MNDEVFALATQLVSPSYVAQAQQARRARETKFKSLLAQRRLPDNGWDEGTLRLLLKSYMCRCGWRLEIECGRKANRNAFRVV